MGIDWKAVFGDKESLTLEELENALKGRKFADLESGEYVSKAKYDERIGKATERITELEGELEGAKKAAQGGADETQTAIAKLTSELEAVTKRLTDADSRAGRLEREKAVADKLPHVSDKLRRVAMQDAEALVDDETDFTSALARVIEADPDYAVKAEDAPPKPWRTGDPVKQPPVTDEAKAAAEGFARAAGVEVDKT